MSAVDEDDRERGGDDMLAAEYVLGVLAADERREAARRIEIDTAFARLVDAWEMRLSPMAAAYPAIEPPAALKSALDRRLFNTAQQVVGATESRGGLWSSLAFWRGLALAGVAAAALLVAVPYLTPPSEPAHRMVASLAAEGSAVHYLVVYDDASGEVALSHVAGEREAGKDFELWMIAGNQPPVSMGVIPAGAATHMAVPAEMREKLDAGAVLAVSLEPAGGSPTGQPTGAVVATGDLKTI